VPAVTRRSGTGLTELVVALALASVVTTVAVAGLTQHRRAQQRRDAAARAEQIVLDVARILRVQLGRAVGPPRLLADTALQLQLLRGTAKACATEPARLTLPADPAWWSAPRAGDSVAVLDTLSGVDWKASVLAVATLRASPSCPAGGIRLTLSAPVPATAPAMFLPVRVSYLVRLAPYRASDGQWWFGERLCTPVCGAMQPIAGPLRSPAEGGFRLRQAAGDGVAVLRLDLRVRATISGQDATRMARVPVGAAP